jgi:hypothetical protein
MSSPRQLLSALWAALWLHGRLLGLRLRRLFGRRPEVHEGHDFHFLGADVAATEADRNSVEIPAELAARLDATRAELLGHARDAAERRARPMRPRGARSIAVAAAAVLGLGVVGVGATALVAGSTGVPAVDRLLGVYDENLDRSGTSDHPGAAGDLQPSASKAADPIEVTAPDGSASVTTFYIARDGRICWAVADQDGRGAGTVSCEQPRNVANGIAEGGYVPGIEVDDTHVTLRGYVGEDVLSLTGRGPAGPLDVRLGSPWKPAASELGTLRPFVAVGRLDPETLSDPAGMQDALTLRNYLFDAETGDGRRFSIEP